MRKDWSYVYLKDCLILGNGKSRPLSHGDIPVYGGNGILEFCDSHNYANGTIIIGRVGAYCGSLYISMVRFGYLIMHYPQRLKQDMT